MKKIIGLVFGALFFALSFATAAQEAKKVARIGYLAPVFPCSGSVPTLEAFRQGLRDLGYVENKNITIECRSAGGKLDHQPDLAVELVQLKVDIIVAAGGEPTPAQPSTRLRRSPSS